MAQAAGERVAYYNGTIIPERDVRVPFRDRGFKYGDAVFDTTRTFGHRIFRLPLASVYPLYVEKVGKKGRTTDELDAVICWLTGYDERELKRHIAEGTTLADFFGGARLNPNASLITGVICGVRVETIEDPLMQQIRYLDKLVDELAKGRPLEKVLRD